jgi:Alkylmercury lyase
MDGAALAGFAEGESFVLRPGVRMPDWSRVTDPAARTALAAAMAVSGRRERWSGLDPDEDRVWQAVLRGFAALGTAPSPATLAGLTPDFAARLASLQRRDLVVLGGDGVITAAYPFCAWPTPHRVRLGPGGAEPFALCAIDALGARAMFGCDTVVRSACATCGRAIRIATCAGGQALGSVDPDSAVVWSGIHYAGGCAATSGCALKLFFCSDEHLETWRGRTDQAVPGFRLMPDAALQVGIALFGPMLARSR